MQDHERVERGDAAIAAHVSGGERRGIARAAAGCELESAIAASMGGECAVVVEVAMLDIGLIKLTIIDVARGRDLCLHLDIDSFG
jgi:hypothetical protein